MKKTLSERDVIEILDRRDVLYRYQPRCPECRNQQVQLMATEKPAKWRCRMCRHPFTDEPVRVGV